MRNFYLLLLFSCFIALLAFDYSSAAADDDSPVLSSPITGLDVQVPAKLNLNDLNNKSGGSGSDPVVVGDKDHFNKRKDGVRNDMDKTNSSPTLGVNNDHKLSTEKEKSKVESIVKEGDNKNKVNEELKPKEKPKDGDKEEIPSIKENSPPPEECGASNRCNDEENHLVACLRVPGNESPELSLLVQNKGGVPLTVWISAPNYVDLETKKFKLPHKENKKVKVSIKHGGTDTMIILKSGGKALCSIDFKDVVAHNSEKESSTTHNSKYAIILNHTPYIVVILLVLILLVGSAFICVRFKHRHSPTGDTKYQKLDMELPLAGGGGVGSKPDSDVSDGWDNGWDDNWDDEEAPKTPSMPVTPSLSSKGLAPRRSNKEAWKD